jgi:outer membrane lipoprotein-sorting protein
VSVIPARRSRAILIGLTLKPRESMSLNRRFQLFCLAAMLLPLTGCLFRSHRVEPRLASAVLREASRDDLVQRINAEASKVQTLNGTVDISAQVGGAKKGKITEYQDVRGYLLVRQPNMLRLIGLFPVVRNKAFDMVSDGNQFKLSIPPKNRFVVGRNDLVQPGASTLESLRPQAIFDALLLHPIDKNEIAVLESDTEPVKDPKTKKVYDQPDYVIDVIRQTKEGPVLSRKVVFSRVDLMPHRQIVYDKQGNIVTDARYENVQNFDGINFPATIEIYRPQEEYSIVLTVVKMQANQPLRDDQFALEQPPGSTLVRLDQPQTPGPSAHDGQPQKQSLPKYR